MDSDIRRVHAAYEFIENWLYKSALENFMFKKTLCSNYIRTRKLPLLDMATKLTSSYVLVFEDDSIALSKGEFFR